MRKYNATVVSKQSYFRTYAVMAWCFSQCWITAGQLFLIAGTPTPKSNDPNAAVILRVEEATQRAEIHEKILDSEGLLTLVDVSHERRVAVVARRIPDRMAMIDMDSAKVIKQCNSGTPENSTYAEWLGDLPSGQLALLSKYRDATAPTAKGVWGIALDRSDSCEGASQPISGSDIRLPLNSGRAGVGPLGAQEPVTTGLDSDGTMWFNIGDIPIYFEPKIPASVSGTPRSKGTVILVNNGSMIVLSLWTGENIIAMYRKSDATWHKVAKPNDGFPTIRAFGRFLVMAEARTRSAIHKESAGRDAWRKGRSAHGPMVARTFDEAREVYPGVLHIRDIESQKQYRIQTDQADSEVVLIEGNQVYYRVSDELFRAELTAKGTISIGTLVAKSDLLSDAHWAFFSR